ncbi:hypothetical protein ACF0H5_009824 [Mactra antiquata]
MNIPTRDLNIRCQPQESSDTNEDVTSRSHALNDLNAPHGIYQDPDISSSIFSNEDNTQYPTTTGSNEPQRRNGKHRKTISNFVRDIEDNKRYLENEINPAVDSDNMRSNSGDNSSTTFVKTPYGDSNHSVDLRSTSGPRRQYVQNGNDNIMFIYESKESRRVNYCKQIGNKNVMVHLNVNSNLCQLVDQHNGKIPLDTKGEVWLEIKRRSQVRGEFNSEASVPNCYTEAPCALNTNNNESTTLPCFNDPVQGRLSPIEHTESVISGVLPLDDLDMEHYSTISIFKREDSLQIKFSKNEDSIIDVNNLKESPILSHKKVIDFLTSKGNNFDVTIQDWEYDDESAYSYIPAFNTDEYDPSLYSKPITESSKPYLPRQKRLEDASSGEDVNDDEHDAYSIVDKPQLIKNQTEAQQETKTDTSLPSRNKQLPMPPRSVPRRRGNVPPPLPIKTMTSCQPSGEATPPPLPQRNIMSPDKTLSSPPVPPPRSVGIPRSPIPHSNDNVTYRQPSPRERRQQRLPPPPGSNYTDYLNQYEWYHGKLRPGSGSNLLSDGEHGLFLVRDSNDTNDNHKFTIEFKDGNEIKKLMILENDNKYYLNGYDDKKFESVVKLIETIRTSGLEVKDSNTNNWKTIKLTPVPKYKPS